MDNPTPPHNQCRRQLTDDAASRGIEIVASTAPPLVEGPYVVGVFTCPHGTTFYTQPTGEQIARWARDGVK